MFYEWMRIVRGWGVHWAVGGFFYCLLPALSQMAWALWQDDQHRAAKLHLSFEVLRAIPVQARVTAGNGSETAMLRTLLEPGRIYVLDRGYAE